MVLVESLGVTRWNPESRAGAVAVKSSRSFDAKAIEQVSDAVRDWAEYQNLAGDADTVESSPIQGNYDWRAYIQEEARAAKERAARARPAKKEAVPPAPAPSVFYA
ncbi:MAG: hypothetical protein QOE90_1412 [Thermoplasmata archaeon]|jgi:hypothetical protein|nr:hypothetical protein [Thermoplasmata archaeon]